MLYFETDCNVLSPERGELLSSIQALQAATLKLQSYINELESKVNKLQKK
jgi:uncharacterized protein YlxW (UPF0749 family)